MHMHGNRMWLLGSGYGNLNDCLAFTNYDGMPPIYVSCI